MTIIPFLNEDLETPLAIAQRLSKQFALTAIERDYSGGTPKLERDQIRESGLLSLIIPKEYGGLGASWFETMQIVREIATTDSSIAHLFGFQHLMLATVYLFSKPEQWECLFERTAKFNWFWGNALNPIDERLIAKVFPDWHELSGKKSFCSGAIDSEMLIVSAREKPSGDLLIAAIPTARSGIKAIHDWDNMGQRQTDSGSVIFEKVRVEKDEFLREPGPLKTPFACLRPLIAQLILTNIYLGIAEGAFADAREYTLHQARPWHTSATTTNHDPYILNHYGDFWVGIESTKALSDIAASKLDDAWRKKTKLTEDERGEVALSISSAKVLATRSGLDITNRMFEVMGSSATHAGLRLDRHWRNLRTHTLHDPLDYKIKELGEWALNNNYPKPTFYS